MSLKFNIDLDKYEGEDLIFLIGTPGSKWSHAHIMMCEHPDINKTDWSEVKFWDSRGENVHGIVSNTGGHRGAYWGPGNMYGQNFGRLDILSKEDFVKEFMDAFEDWNGIKIIKSHWFAYNIDYLHSIFPKAKIVMCYSCDIYSFYWWIKSGGWGLGYANYAWYENDVRMLEKIKEENGYILKFAIDRDLDFDLLPRSILFDKAGLRKTKLNTRTEIEQHADPRVKCKIAVYAGGYVSNFDHLRPSDSYLFEKRRKNEI